MLRLLFIVSALLALSSLAFAATPSQNPILVRLTKLQTQIDILSQENIQLKSQIQELSLRFNTLSSPKVVIEEKNPTQSEIELPVVIKKTVSFSGVTFSGSQVQIAAMKQFLLQKEELLMQAGYVTNLQVGLFEFITPNGIFISFDSGTNPEGVTAFPLKIAYQYQNDAFTKLGVFEYQAEAGKYLTKFGTNLFVNAQRIKLANPLYTGKLIGITTIPSPVVITTPIASIPSIKPTLIETPVKSTSSGTILTLKEIQSLRTAKFNYVAALDAARLASTAQPESLEFRKEIYINLFMLTKTQEALNEIARIEKITGSLPKAIACDAVMISRNAKLKDLEAKYTPICKK